MPKLKKDSGDGSKFVGLRLDQETAAYYSKRAKERGTTLSDFLRNMIVQGMIAETAHEIEQRMRSMLAEMQVSGGQQGGAAIPENVLLSIYTTEQLLTKIVEARNMQDLYEAQDRARAKIKREKGTENG